MAIYFEKPNKSNKIIRIRRLRSKMAVRVMSHVRVFGKLRTLLTFKKLHPVNDPGKISQTRHIVSNRERMWFKYAKPVQCQLKNHCKYDTRMSV